MHKRLQVISFLRFSKFLFHEEWKKFSRHELFLVAPWSIAILASSNFRTDCTTSFTSNEQVQEIYSASRTEIADRKNGIILIIHLIKKKCCLAVKKLIKKLFPRRCFIDKSSNLIWSCWSSKNDLNISWSKPKYQNAFSDSAEYLFNWRPYHTICLIGIFMGV